MESRFEVLNVFRPEKRLPEAVGGSTRLTTNGSTRLTTNGGMAGTQTRFPLTVRPERVEGLRHRDSIG